jgi:hypothetical protein
MIKKNQKIFYGGVCFFIFLFLGFFCLSISKIFAAGLEVKYPEVAGQIITANSKLPDYVKYLFNAGMSLGFLAVLISLIIAGATYFLSPISVELRSSAKDRASGAISGLLILVLTYLIITTINPQLSFFNSSELPATPPEPAPTKASGVYFYKSDCFDNNIQANTSSIPDLGPLKNKVGYVSTINDSNGYITILYDNTNFWGKCQYVVDAGCLSVDPFAASASIYRYDYSPNGDGVYFYRKPCFNTQPSNNVNDFITQCNKFVDDNDKDIVGSGYYKVSNSEISGIYIGRLEDLKFEHVPKNEQNCIKYDKTGKCITRNPQSPSLGGENISSVIINGNYLVLFVYLGPQDNESGPWTSCQEFPIANDVNRMGPQQIKWQNIRNSNGVVPNYVIIIPIQK